MHRRTMMTIWFVVLLLVGGAVLTACSRETTPSTPATTAVAPTQAVATAVPTVDEAPSAPVSTQAPAEPTEAPTTEEAPTIDAAALLEVRCVDCHSLNRTTEARYTQEQWQVVVTRMIRHGAVLNAEEETALVAYLAETYRP